MGPVDLNTLIITAAGALVSTVASVAAWAVTTSINRLLGGIAKLGDRVTVVEKDHAVLKQRVDVHDRDFTAVHGRLERAGA